MGAKRAGDLSGWDILAKHGAQHLHHGRGQEGHVPHGHTLCWWALLA